MIPRPLVRCAVIAALMLLDVSGAACTGLVAVVAVVGPVMYRAAHRQGGADIP